MLTKVYSSCVIQKGADGEGAAAAEVLALQLKQMQTCNESPRAPQAELQTNQQYLTTTTDPPAGLLYVTANYEQF